MGPVKADCSHASPTCPYIKVLKKNQQAWEEDFFNSVLKQAPCGTPFKHDIFGGLMRINKDWNLSIDYVHCPFRRIRISKFLTTNPTISSNCFFRNLSRHSWGIESSTPEKCCHIPEIHHCLKPWGQNIVWVHNNLLNTHIGTHSRCCKMAVLLQNGVSVNRTVTEIY